MMDAPEGDPLQAAYDNDLPELARLIAKYPITKGDKLWMGLLFEDYMDHLRAEGLQLLLDAGLEVNYADHGFTHYT